MSQKQYETKKESQRKIYLARVMAMSKGIEDEEQILKEAEEKFQREYPPYK